MPYVRESCLMWKILVGYPKLAAGALLHKVYWDW